MAHSYMNCEKHGLYYEDVGCTKCEEELRARTPDAEMREQFEAWARSSERSRAEGRHKSCMRFADDHPNAGEYLDQDTHERWLAWQACWPLGLAAGRKEALEEAAKVADRFACPGMKDCGAAAAIRDLQDQK